MSNDVNDLKPHTCPDCGETDLGMFHQDASRKSGYARRCKRCEKKYRKKLQARRLKERLVGVRIKTVRTQADDEAYRADYHREYRRIHDHVRDALTDGTFTPAVWKQMLFECGYRCMNPKCRSSEDLTLDHVRPLRPKRGQLPGIHSVWNAQILCRRCNTLKGNNFLDYRTVEWLWHPSRKTS